MIEKRSINEQLNIGVPRNPIIPSRYARGLMSAQPQLFFEDWSLDNYNDIRSLENPSNADGDSFSNLTNAEIKAVCGKEPLFAGKKKRNWGLCVAREMNKQSGSKIPEFIFEEPVKTQSTGANTINVDSLDTSGFGQTKAGMSSGTMIVVGLLMLSLIGGGIYMAVKKD